MSGKTTLFRMFVHKLQKEGRECAVLDPLNDTAWKADYQTDDADAFLKYAKQKKNLKLFIDESGTSIGKYNRPMQWVTTTSRHLGHDAFIVCHSLVQLDRTLRNQCNTCYLFRTAARDKQIVAEEWDRPELLTSQPLEKGEFYKVPRFGDLEKFRILFDKQTIERST